MIKPFDSSPWIELPTVLAWAFVFASGSGSDAAIIQATIAALIVAVATAAAIYLKRWSGHTGPPDARWGAIAFALSIAYVYANLGVMWPNTPGPDRWIITAAAIYTLLLLALSLAVYYVVRWAQRVKAAVLG